MEKIKTHSVIYDLKNRDHKGRSIFLFFRIKSKDAHLTAE